MQALFENRSRPGLVKCAICESAQFSPLATTEVERAGYLIYCIVNQPEVLPGSLKLTINYPYPYKSMKERAKKYLGSPANIYTQTHCRCLLQQRHGHCCQLPLGVGKNKKISNAPSEISLLYESITIVFLQNGLGIVTVHT